tara:strand:- start:4863 stop:5312 length:450 start_codon:yes stop_codon:yes gene_type:complete
MTLTEELQQPETTAGMIDLYRKMMSEQELHDLRMIAENYVHLLTYQRKCCPTIKYHRTFIRSFYYVVHWRLQGHDISIKHLAEFHELSWNSMLRRVQHWEDHELCKIVRRGTNTFVFGSPKGMVCALDYTRNLKKLFVPQHQYDEPSSK